MSMLREEYEEKSKQFVEFFRPCRVVYLSGVQLTMISLNNKDAVPWSINSGITDDQLPFITCSYRNKKGTLKFIDFEFNDLAALKIKWNAQH